jgi:hypothetical protein
MIPQSSRSRKNSVAESLDSSISGFSSKLKVDKRNAKGETALQIVSQTVLYNHSLTKIF